MAIRKRKWSYKGAQRTSWVVDYRDANRVRRLKTFTSKQAATDWAAAAHIDLKRGLHIADMATITVAEAADAWLQRCAQAGLERSTQVAYRGHVANHIKPLLGSLRLNKLTVPGVRAFESHLHANGVSLATASKILTSLHSLCQDARERGLAVVNPVADFKRNRNGNGNGRHAKQLQVGIDLPSIEEAMRLLSAEAPPLWRALFTTALLTGLRRSELRGLAWHNIDWLGRRLAVTQRADRWDVLSSPKTRGSCRSVPLAPPVLECLRVWQPLCPETEASLVFCDSKHEVLPHSDYIDRRWIKLQLSAKVSENGEAKYGGIHCLRHFFASWCAGRKEDGGLGLPLKTVQAFMGHAKISMTSDRYGHLFPMSDADELFAAGAQALLGEPV